MSSGDLEIVSVDASDMGDYYCIAVNSVQISSIEARLLVDGR